jgi:RND family efflux transporter MFP subunit
MLDRPGWAGRVAGLAVLAWGLAVASGQQRRGAEYAGDTRPSGDVTLAFVRSGLIDTVEVKEGDRVKAGDVLMRLDDELERAKVEELQAQADNDVRVRASEAQLAQKKNELAIALDLQKNDAATELEVQKARLEVRIGELSLELAKFQHAQDRRKYEQAKLELDRMVLRSPIDGVVEQAVAKEGESAEALQKIVRIVDVTPLWVDVYVPVDDSGKLEPGDGQGGSKALVRFGESSDSPVREAKIIHKASVATGAMPRTLKIRLEVANEDNRPAGERVWVRFPAISADGTASGAAEADADDGDVQTASAEMER